MGRRINSSANQIGLGRKKAQRLPCSLTWKRKLTAIHSPLASRIKSMGTACSSINFPWRFLWLFSETDNNELKIFGYADTVDYFAESFNNCNSLVSCFFQKTGDHILKYIKIQKLIQAEYHRQREGIELIASENIVTRQVMSAMGSYLSNKYVEEFRANATIVVARWSMR